MATDIVTRIRPLGDRLVVKPKIREEMTRSGIVLPDTAKEKPQEGVVVAVGLGQLTDDGKRLPMDVEPGQSVLYAKYAGSEVKLDDEDYLILRVSDVLAIMG
jgi:chaperonin GroES